MQRHRRQSRITARHAIFAFAPLVAVYLVGAERVTLGGSLDALWLLLTAAAILHCLEQRVSGATRVRQLLSLTLVLILFFPVISLDDDLPLAELADLQSVVSPPEKHQGGHAGSVAHAPVLPATPHLPILLQASSEQVAPPPSASSPSVWRQSSGNHSPPIA